METLSISRTATKPQVYEELLPQLRALLHPSDEPISRMANCCAALKDAFSWLWVGFYLVKGNRLILGPFQGPLACSSIDWGKGVCGRAWSEGKTLVVPDVNAFPGHIACSSLSKSEIVVPVFVNHEIVAVLDVDSERLNNFDETDRHYLEEICKMI